MTVAYAILIAVVAFDCGVIAGAWWAGRDQIIEYTRSGIPDKEIIKRVMRGIL